VAVENPARFFLFAQVTEHYKQIFLQVLPDHLQYPSVWRQQHCQRLHFNGFFFPKLSSERGFPLVDAVSETTIIIAEGESPSKSTGVKSISFPLFLITQA
jgi:hypothetical protein